MRSKMSGHEKGCRCFVCEASAKGLDAKNLLKQMQDKMLEKYGFYVHLVEPESNSKLEINAHTHGLERYNHLDFQIVLGLPERTIQTIFMDLVDLVKSGEKFHHGQELNNIILNFPVKLISARESNRDVLRVVFPDPSGNIDEESMREDYRWQYDSASKSIWKTENLN